MKSRLLLSMVNYGILIVVSNIITDFYIKTVIKGSYLLHVLSNAILIVI